MAEGIYEYLRRKDPELMEDLHFEAEVGEFPMSRIVLSAEQLPIEEFDAFSDDPLDFEEFTATLADDVHQIYIFSRILNRFSEKYQSISLQLEKGLAKLASCCVTKAILEKKGFTFPQLENLTIKPLYCAVSFNFRKVHAAVKETTNKNYRMWAQLIDIEFGWHTLAERLKATEEKIRDIQSGKINVDHLIDRIRFFREKESAAPAVQPRETGPSRKAYAYPVMGPVLREMTSETKGAVPGAIAGSRCDMSAYLQPEPLPETENIGTKTYDSMKQRKKAERLARKHARQAEPKGTGPAGTIPDLQTILPADASGSRTGLPEPEGEDIHMFGFLSQHRRDGKVSGKVPVPVGGPLPERA